MKAEDYAESAALVIEECTKALKAIESEKVLEYLEMLTVARKVFFVGVGRVLLSLEAMAKRYAHLGIDTVIVGQITEPAITKDDVLIVREAARPCFRQELQEKPKQSEPK